MLKLNLTLALICSLLAFGHAGKDEAWCDVKGYMIFKFDSLVQSFIISWISGDTSIQPDFILPGNQYQAVIERNDLIKISTESIVEIFDGQRNIGIATQTYLGTTTKTFSYYNINELLVITRKELFNLNDQNIFF